VAGVVLVFMAGALVWRERVTAASVVGVLVAISAIVLLNNF
jgi:multidrug transporter EmrE-like cation transporter